MTKIILAVRLTEFQLTESHIVRVMCLLFLFTLDPPTPFT